MIYGIFVGKIFRYFKINSIFYYASAIMRCRLPESTVAPPGWYYCSLHPNPNIVFSTLFPVLEQLIINFLFIIFN